MSTSGTCFISDNDENIYKRYHNKALGEFRPLTKTTWDKLMWSNPNATPITNNQNTMQPFEIRVTLPIRTTQLFHNNGGGDLTQLAIVTVNEAIVIRDAINRQLNGLKATEPKAKDPTKKKLVKKTAKKK